MITNQTNIIALLRTHRNGRLIVFNSDRRREKTHEFANAKNNKITIWQRVEPIGCDALIETG